MKYVWAMLAVTLMGCSPPRTATVSGSTPAPPGGASAGMQQAITADQGGVVRLGSEVELAIPAHSLTADTTIAIARLDKLPAGVSDAVDSFGQGYECSPTGTQFALANPALMTVRYDGAALGARGFDPRTLEIYYFDPAMGRYLNVPSTVDTVAGTVSARIEHFTSYVLFAQTLVPGNHPPFVAAQALVPALPRVGAPLTMRVTAHDNDLNGAVAGVQLFYRRGGSGNPFTAVTMTLDGTIGANDSYAVNIPASFTATLSVGNTIEYYFQATDNLGAAATSGSPMAPLVATFAHSYASKSLYLTPAPLTITAGYSRAILAYARDEANTLYQVVPDSASASNNIGTIASNSTSGIQFTAGKVASGNVSASFAGGDIASASVTVTVGELQSITILGPNGMAPTGTLVLTEGQHYQLDAIGADAYGNTIYVLPQWGVNNAVGFVNQTGLFYTLDGVVRSGNISAYTPNFGSVVATVGNVTATQWVQINPRNWTEIGALPILGSNEYNPSLAFVGGTLYASFNTDFTAIHLYHWNGGAWIADPDLVTGASDMYPAPLAACNGTLYVAASVNSGDGTFHLTVSHLAGNLWVQDGSMLNVSPTQGVAYPSIACDGATPYVAFEATNPSPTVFVKKFDGTSWTGVGGPVGQDPGWNIVQPSIALHNGAPWVAFGAQSPSLNVELTYVYQWNGTAWVIVGSSGLDVSSSRPIGNFAPQIVWGSTAPWVSENDGLIQRLFFFDGSNWQNIAGWDTQGFQRSPGLAVDGDTAYTSFINGYNPGGVSNPQGAEWVYHSSSQWGVTNMDEVYPINLDLSSNGTAPFTQPVQNTTMIMGPSSTPYIAFQQGVPTGPSTGRYNVHVFALK